MLEPSEDSVLPVVGLDIGGANIKAADTHGRTAAIAFPMWKRSSDLTSAVRDLLERFPKEGPLAVTMTGELADCFPDAATGVRFIGKATAAAVGKGRPVYFYSLTDGLTTLEALQQRPDDFAAANWHALAMALADTATEPSLLVDIGSTTCDLIPLEPGRVATEARDDFDRLRARQLVYVGIGRTPVCSLVETLPIDGQNVPVMNELFATSGDCAVVLGLLAEDASDCETADGQPRTRTAACSRLARMVGLDHRRFSPTMANEVSRCVLSAVADRILDAAHVQPASRTWILSGHGQMLLSHRLPGMVKNRIDLGSVLGEAISRVAPAYAVACLYRNVGLQVNEDRD